MKCTSSSLGSHPHLGQTPGLEEASQPNARSPTEDDEHERVACTRKVRLDCVAASSPPKAQGDGTRRALCHSSSVLTFFCGGSMDLQRENEGQGAEPWRSVLGQSWAPYGPAVQT